MMKFEELSNIVQFDLDMCLFNPDTGEQVVEPVIGNEMNQKHIDANRDLIELLDDLTKLDKKLPKTYHSQPLTSRFEIAQAVAMMEQEHRTIREIRQAIVSYNGENLKGHLLVLLDSMLVDREDIL